MKNIQYEEYKRQEYLGDGLLQFLLRELLITDWENRNEARAVEFDLKSNKTLNKVGIEMGVTPNELDGSHKRYASALEVKVYKKYQIGGIDYAKEYVESIIHAYTKLK